MKETQETAMSEWFIQSDGTPRRLSAEEKEIIDLWERMPRSKQIAWRRLAIRLLTQQLAESSN